jgi:hypothetical protein
MGTLRYDGQWVEFDDELLTHLQIVIISKLRKGESFLMTWRDPAERGDGRSSIWLHPTHSVTFHISDAAPVDAAWVEQLTRSANSPEGLVVTRRS